MKKTTVPVYAAFFFILVLSVSCHRDLEAPDATFRRIEMCMESLPDTALYLLKSIPHTEKLRGKLQADYALLLTQAMDRNCVKFTSDSLIALALNYYTVERGDSATRAKAQYYYGRVLRELGKDEEALTFLSSAKEMFGNIQCCKMFAMATDEIGMINRKKKLYQESLENFRESYTIYEELKDSLSLVRAGQNIGRAYLFQNKWDSCYFYYINALALAREKQYSSEVSILHELGILCRSMGELKKSERYFLAAYEKETDEERKYVECMSLGYLYIQMGDVENARKYFKMSINSSKEYTRIDAYNNLYFLEKDIDNFEEAIIYHEKADSIVNVLDEVDSQELITELQKQYENEKLRNDNLQLKVDRTVFIFCGTVIFLIVAFYMCYYYYKSKNHRKKIAEIESQIRDNEEEIKRYQQEMEEIQELKDQVLEENRILEENRMKVGELNGKIVLLSMQNKTLSGLLKELGGELTVGPSSEQYISAFRLLLAIKEGTLRGKLSNGERYKLFSLFDLLYSNYVTRLLDKTPLLTKHDLEICCFLKFGLTNEELARIFQTSSDSVTKAKGRLKGRLGISPQEDLNVFLRDF
ncbi:hypothetical protein [Bacteroides sp.]|uniref:hypothetical protein n=1 Tax=Bacteroides sp. TaxID=29523 RepID=UPI002A80F6B2|nr:hypothetical protein [Bacteroides sp.]